MYKLVHLHSKRYRYITKRYTPATSLLFLNLRVFTVNCRSSSARTLTLFLLSLSLYHEFCFVYFPVFNVFISLWLHDVDTGGLVAFCRILGGELSISTGNCFYIVNYQQLWLKYSAICNIATIFINTVTIILQYKTNFVSVYMFIFQFNETCVSNAYPPNKT